MLIQELIYLENQNYKEVIGVYKDLFQDNKDIDSIADICFLFQCMFYEERLNFLLSLL